MNVCHTLICLFFLMLQDGNIGLINAQIPIYTGTEGESITVTCSFTGTASRKFFCKDECKSPLITFGDRAQSGRFGMRYVRTLTGSRLDVTITQLRKPDSGLYWCGLYDYNLGPYRQFGINVRDARILRPFPPLPTPPTTTQSFRRSTISSSSSTKTTNQSEQEETEITDKDVPLYVGLTLLIFVLLFSLAVLILCKKRDSKPKEHPEEAVYANVTETSQVYEEIRVGDGPSRSAPVENSADSGEITAAASRPLSKIADDSSDVLYTQVDFSKRAASSLNSAPSGPADNVIYAVPRTRTDAKVD